MYYSGCEFCKVLHPEEIQGQFCVLGINWLCTSSFWMSGLLRVLINCHNANMINNHFKSHASKLPKEIASLWQNPLRDYFALDYEYLSIKVLHNNKSHEILKSWKREIRIISGKCLSMVTSPINMQINDPQMLHSWKCISVRFSLWQQGYLSCCDPKVMTWSW